MRVLLSLIPTRIFLLMAIAAWPIVSQAQNPDRVILADWLGSLPTKEISGSFFQHPQFTKGLEKVIPNKEWQKILGEYNFLQPVEEVEAMGRWMVVIGQLRYGKENDMVIFLSSIDARVEAICRAYVLSVWYVPMNWDGVAPYQVASSPASTELTYYLRDGKQVHVSRPVGENCANGNAKLAVERWQKAVRQP